VTLLVRRLRETNQVVAAMSFLSLRAASRRRCSAWRKPSAMMSDPAASW